MVCFSLLQRFLEVRDTEVKRGPLSHLAAGGGASDRQPLQHCVTGHCVHAVPVGVPLSAQHLPSALQQPVPPKEQHQLPGPVNDQCRAVLFCTSYIWWHGDVSCSKAALPSRKSLPLHFWLLCSDCCIRRYSGCCSSARLAVVLHEKTAGFMVWCYSGEEKQIMAFFLKLWMDKTCVFFFNTWVMSP